MTYQKLQLSISGCLLGVITLGVAPRSPAETYLVSDLGVPPPFSYFFGGVLGAQINASGDVAGYLFGDYGQPLVVTNGNRTTLSALHLNTSGNVSAINAAGVVVGSSCTGTDPIVCQGVEWTDGVPRELARGINFTPSAINGAGHIVGFVGSLGYEPQVASVYRDGSVSALPTVSFNPTISEALAINDSNVIVGNASRPPPEGGPTITHAILWNGSTVQDLRADAGATGINDLGQVVGYARPPTGVQNHAASWMGGKFIDLGAPNDYFSAANAVNAAGVIVGEGRSSESTQEHALVWISGVMSDLNDLIDPTWASHILLQAAVSISDSGQILVNGYDTATNLTHAYVLSPSGAAIAAEPTFSVIPRAYASTQTVTLAVTTVGAIIHYTLDGTLPTSRGLVWSSVRSAIDRMKLLQ